MAVDADCGTVFGAPDSARPHPASIVLGGLASAPGTTYAAIVDERSGTLLAESGSAGSGATLTGLLAWAHRVTRGRGPDDVDDLVLTTDRAFHVLRRRSAAGAPVWAYVRVDRSRGNLALARRAAAGATAAGPARPAPPRDAATRSGLPRRPPTALPGPRRAAAPHARPRRPSDAPVDTGLPAPASGWSADITTLRRLLAGLHRLD